MPQETDHLETLYREGASEQPPDGIDRAITAAARSALKPWYQRRGPLTGISTAAALLVAAGLVSIQYLPVENGPITASPSPAVELEQSRDLRAVEKAVSDYAEVLAGEVRQEPAQDVAPAARLPADRAPMERTSSVAGMNQLADIKANAEEDALTCELSPHFDGRAYEILPADEGPPRIRSDGRQWQCRNGVWDAVEDLEDSADLGAPPLISPTPAAPSEQQ